MKKRALIKSLLVTPLFAGVAIATPIIAQAADNYSVDPRFVGNPDIDKEKTVSIKYYFHHGGTIYENNGYFRGGYWAGGTSVTFKYKYLSINKMVVLADGSSTKSVENSSTQSGGGFYDTNFLGKFGYKAWTQYGVSQAEKRTNAKYINPGQPNNRVDGFDYSNGLKTYINDWAKNGVWYGAMHYNQKSIFTDNEYFYQVNSSGRSDYLVYGDENHVFNPFSWINRYLVASSQHEAVWSTGPLGELALKNPDIKWINNTTSVVRESGTSQGKSIAPDGAYAINDNHDSDRKMLSWGVGENNNKYFTTGDKISIRNMSPIIQSGATNYGLSKNGALTKFVPGQTFKTSVWVPDNFDYKSGDAKIYAVRTNGERVDVTSRFNFSWGDTQTDYSSGGSTKTNMRRLVATIKNINDDTSAGYNNVATVGYSMIVPLTVGANANTDAPYAIRGGSQIIDGTWHDTGTDKIYIWRPKQPAATPTTSNATVYNNDSKTDYNENKTFYETGLFANNKTFRSNESDGYYVWHSINKVMPVPNGVLADKGADSSITTWQTTQPLVFTIPYDNRYVTPIGASVRRASPSATQMDVGTNGITSKDTGTAYVVTIPATLINAYREQDSTWGVALKYKVKSNLPGGGVKISSVGSTADEISGTQSAAPVYNYLESPLNTFTFDTMQTSGDKNAVSQFGSNLNNSVHLVNGQQYGYNTNWTGIGSVSGSSGVGEPLKKFSLTADVKANQIVDWVGIYKGTKLIWTGNVNGSNAALSGSSNYSYAGLSSSQVASGFSGTITNNNNLNAVQQVTVKANDSLLNNKNFLYDTNDLRVVVHAHTDDAKNQSNVTGAYGDNGKALTASLTASNGLTSDSSSTLSQFNSRVKPGVMLAKHDQWPANASDSGSSFDLSNSSIQARETFDFRVAQFLGNSNLPTEAYATPFKLDVATSASSPLTSVGDIKVKAYDLGGNISDATDQFTITNTNGHVTATMKDQYVNQVTGKTGSAYNKLYILSVPMKNQTDTATTVTSVMTGSATINGQEIKAPVIKEFIPPETPYMYGYSSTSTADAFNPKDPEKDKGKIAYNTSDGASTSAQISTAPIQWVIREQLGDTSTKYDQKYNYAKFSATFPDANLFQNGSKITWHVYNEAGADVSSQFNGAKVGSTGYKIEASSGFLSNKNNYSHKYYFVIDQSTQNNHANRLGMAVKAGLTNVYTAFRNLRSSMTVFFGKVGIGNTDKTVATQNFDMQYDYNLLQINSTKSNLNEKTSELNDNPFTNGKYTIQNVALSRPLAGYTVTGAASQYATNARAYESYTTSFSANGTNNAQQVTANSIKITDSMTNKDVTSQYTVTVKDQQVIVTAKQAALDRLHEYHKVSQNATVQDIVTFHVDTWGNRSSDSVVTWYANHNINGYDDAKAVERVTIPKSHAGHKEIYVSPSGQDKWQSTDLTLKSMSDTVDLKIRVTVPNDLHNKDFTDFIAHYIGTEITPFMSQDGASATVMLGENNEYSKGSKLTLVSSNIANKSMNDSRVVWQLPSTIETQLNTTNAINAAPTYTVIIHNIQFTPNNSRTVGQYMAYLDKDNKVKIPVGGVTTSSTGSQSPLDGNYFEGKNGAIVDPTIGSLGSGTTLGSHSGKINIILPSAAAKQEGYVNGGESNTSFTNGN